MDADARTHSPADLFSAGAPSLGVIGGGQLARMMLPAASELGLSLSVMAEGPETSAYQAAPHSAIGDYTDLEQLRSFCSGLDVVTFDHEHVPAEHLRALIAEGVNFQPRPEALLFAQDKLKMRERMEELGLPNPAWTSAESVEQIRAFGQEHGYPIVVKTPRGGYDGKGVLFVRTPEDADEAADWLSSFPRLLVEEGVAFSRELSALAARSPQGEVAVWDIAETVQTDGVCDEVIAPAPDIDPVAAEAAQQAARTVAESLGVTGVFAVELFETPGRGAGFVINELAMRPHNTGHWTMDGSATSQFEQHLRAVAGLPLGSPERTAEASVMKNYLGGAVQDTYAQFPAAMAAAPEAKIHHYAKSVRSGRKIGHVNITGAADEIPEMLERARTAARILAEG